MTLDEDENEEDEDEDGYFSVVSPLWCPDLRVGFLAFFRFRSSFFCQVKVAPWALVALSLD